MCGIFGVAGSPDAAELVQLGLFSLQHRGQESAGIVSTEGGRLHAQVAMGLVSEVFADGTGRLPGRTAIGHVRYATTGASQLQNAQPLVFKTGRGPLAIGHNGNLTNAQGLRARLESEGAIFQSTTDSEVIVHLLARAAGSLEDAVAESLRQVEGAYSLLFLAPEALVAVRDPRGFRPLVLGRLGKAHVFASETTALNLIGAKLVRELAPGEMAVARGGRVSFRRPFAAAPAARCIFEHVYFARPDSLVFGRGVQAARRELGRALARQMRGVEADVVVPVPDSGIPAALGFSDESGIPFEMGLMRSHYVSRTFIKPTQELREKAAMLKLAPVPESLRGRKIVLVDDSIVRGTTSRRICRLLRQAGARSIHMAVSSPPILSPCHYGIDTPRASELVANRRSLESLRRFLGVDGLHYLSLEGMLQAVGGKDSSGWCTACFTRRYPTPIPDYAGAA